ncbi:MAG: matrixin family metalloprotease [Polyangiales bacterium]
MGRAPLARRALTARLVILTGLLLATEARAYCRTTWPHAPPGVCEGGTTVSWGVGCLGVHLNTRSLREVSDAGQDLDPVLRAAFARSLRVWSDADCGRTVPALQLVDAGDVDAPLDLALDGRNVVSVNRRWSPDAYHLPGTVAFTVVTTDARSGSLLEADIEINARSDENPLGRRWDDGPPTWGVVDAPSALLHEVGHLAGLWHSQVPGAVMEASMDIERQRRDLTADDRAGICAVYPGGPTAPRPSRCDPQRPVARPTPAGGCAVARVHRRAEGAAGSVALAFALLRAWVRRRRPRC